MNKFWSALSEVLKVVLISLAIVLPIRYFLMQPFFVKGASMEPNYEDGQYLLVDEISWRFREPQRGEVAVFKYPNDQNQYYIKRIIGLPGEEIKLLNSAVYIKKVGQDKFVLLEENYLAPWQVTEGDESPIKIEADEYYLLGDNRKVSHDSRKFGSVKKSLLIGRTWIRAWPFSSTAVLYLPQYE